MIPNPVDPMHGQDTPSNDELRVILDAATVGPWEAECDEGEGTVQVNAGSARTFWTENGTGIPAPSWRTTDRILDIEDAWDGEFNQWEANARLIALAPALAAEVIRLREGIAALADLADHCRDIAAETVHRECRALLDGGDPMTARTLETVIREANARHDGYEQTVTGVIECECGRTYDPLHADDHAVHQAAEVARAVREYLHHPEQAKAAGLAVAESLTERAAWASLSDLLRREAAQVHRIRYRVALAAVLGGDSR